MSNIGLTQRERQGWRCVVGMVAVLLLALVPAEAARVRLEWDPPVNNTDGTPITDLTGYTVHYGVASSNYTVVTNVGNVTSCIVSNLGEGVRYFFAVRAYNAQRTESGFSIENAFTVPDLTPPSITPPADRSLTAGSTSGTATVPNLVTTTVVSDNVSPTGSIVVTQSPISGATIGLGVTTVTLTARDQAGNTAQATVRVTVLDKTAPVITAPAPVTVTAGLDDLAGVPNFLATLVVQDNCTPGASLVKSQTPAAGTSVPVGTHSVTIRARDAAGNESQVSVTLTVARANRAPVVDAGADRTLRITEAVSLTGTATDDGLPTGAAVTVTWSKVSGPGTVTFGQTAQPTTSVSFGSTGTYVLRLTASDTVLSASDTVTLTVLPAAVPTSPSNIRITPL